MYRANTLPPKISSLGNRQASLTNWVPPLAPFVALFCLCAALSPVEEISAATFSPTSEESNSAVSQPLENVQDLQQLTPQIEQGRIYIQIDDMRFNVPDGANVESAFRSNRWTDGMVYYVFDPAVTAFNRQAWRDAAAEWSARARLTFIEGTGNGNYIYVKNSTVNWSYIGMIGGAQTMEICNWSYKYLIVHEIGHALGLIHEHCRSDRDVYVIILWNNIQSGLESNFNIQSSTTYGSYDFDSVMHYRKSTFSSNGANTIEPHPDYSAYLNLMGQQTHVSELDGSGMAARYGPPATSPPQIRALNFSKPTGFTVTWNAAAGRTYQVERSSAPTFTNPTIIASNIQGIEPTTSYSDNSTLAQTATRMFYRVVLQP